MNRGSRHYYLKIIPPILSKISLPDCHTRRFLAGIHLKYIQGDSLEENLEGSIREKNDTIRFVSGGNPSAGDILAEPDPLVGAVWRPSGSPSGN